MKHPKSFYITTAISYPNGKPHIGHAYEALATDAIARFNRLDGYDVKFLTGTDEHGLKIQQTADKAGISPQAFVDGMAPEFMKMVAALGCTNDDFIRTTEDRHKKACQELWRRMEANGDIYKSTYAGWYSVRDEAYYQEAETEVQDGVRIATTTKTQVEWMEESSYFFRLSKYQDRLLAHYEANPNFILPESRRNEVLSFVKGGLQDLSISRTNFKWGIPVPNDPDHVMYVWVDALTNYLTATGFPDSNDGHWPADIHIIGKDIIRFHAVYWPAFLMSAGLPLPKMIFGHGFLTNRGEKMSKSLGNVVDPIDMIAQYGLDAVRYYFLSEIPFGNDGSYSHEAIVNRVNADLANNLGNLAQRSLSMIQKNCGGMVPAAPSLRAERSNPESSNWIAASPMAPRNDGVYALVNMFDGICYAVRNRMEDCAIHDCLSLIRHIISEANVYFTEQAPWALKKTDPERMEHVLWVTAETLRMAGLLLQPFIPETAAKLLDLLAVPQDQRTFAHATAEYALKPGTPLPPPVAIFPRLELSLGIEIEQGQDI